jgi:hypothetical protein
MSLEQDRMSKLQAHAHDQNENRFQAFTSFSLLVFFHQLPFLNRRLGCRRRSSLTDRNPDHVVNESEPSQQAVRASAME